MGLEQQLAAFMAEFARVAPAGRAALYPAGLVALVTFNCAVSLRGSTAAAAIIALLPAVAALLAIPVLGEVSTPVQTLAIAAIIVGVLLAATPARRPAPIAQTKRKYL